MSRVNHGYANTYGTTTVPAAAPGPREYTHDTLFPAVRDMVRKQFGLEVFTHALFDPPNAWPPTAWSHDRAAWTVEAKFIVNDYGLRNRLAIITETPGQPTFERRIYAQYAYLIALLEYTNAHAKEMQAVVKAADDKTVADVLAKRRVRRSSELARRRIPVARQDRRARLPDERRRVPSGHEFHEHEARHRLWPARGGQGVDDLTKPVGTRDAVVPRALPHSGGARDMAAKLRAHNIRVQPLEQPHARRGRGVPDQGDAQVRSGGYDMTTLDGTISPLDDTRISRGDILRGHGPADGQRGVLLPRAAGARWVRRLACARTRSEAADRRRQTGVSDLQDAARGEVVSRGQVGAKSRE